jgi:hypothetical protein
MWSSLSPTPAWMHQLSEEPTSPSGEFVFSKATSEWMSFVDGEHGGRCSCGSISIADDVAEDGGSQHLPFRSSFPK